VKANKRRLAMNLKLCGDYGDRQFFVSNALECDGFPFLIVIEADRKTTKDPYHYAMVVAVSLEASDQERFDFATAEENEEYAKTMSPVEINELYAVEMVLEGAFALLWSTEGANYKSLVNRAKQIAGTYDDCDAFKRRMNEGQNSRGNTGWDFIRGSVFLADQVIGEVR
jgi:hypothetical protein